MRRHIEKIFGVLVVAFIAIDSGACKGLVDENAPSPRSESSSTVETPSTSSLLGWWTNETNLSGEQGESDVARLLFVFESDGHFYFTARGGDFKPSCLYSSSNYRVSGNDILFSSGGSSSQQILTHRFEGPVLVIDGLWGRVEPIRWNRITASPSFDFLKLPTCDD